MKEYRKLLNEYYDLKNALLDYTDSFYDGMYYDIQGYHVMYDENDYGEIDSLRNQVKSFRAILTGMKTMKYQFC